MRKILDTGFVFSCVSCISWLKRKRGNFEVKSSLCEVWIASWCFRRSRQSFLKWRLSSRKVSLKCFEYPHCPNPWTHSCMAAWQKAGKIKRRIRKALH